MNLENDILKFLSLANQHEVRMLMVGGAAVNFHGFNRNTGDVDFWLETTVENLEKLKQCLHELGYEVIDFPKDVINGKKNISLIFNPGTPDIELLTRFEINKTFEDAFLESEKATFDDETVIIWHVLSLEDLITSKIKSGRNKDLIDVQELQRIRKKDPR